MQYTGKLCHGGAQGARVLAIKAPEPQVARTPGPSDDDHVATHLLMLHSGAATALHQINFVVSTVERASFTGDR